MDTTQKYETMSIVSDGSLTFSINNENVLLREGLGSISVSEDLIKKSAQKAAEILQLGLDKKLATDYINAIEYCHNLENSLEKMQNEFSDIREKTLKYVEENGYLRKKFEEYLGENLLI
jgi:regulator of replication initiation timing